MEGWNYDFDPEKNAWLIHARGISFEQIIALIDNGKLIQILEHRDKAKYLNQLIYEIDVDGYIYVVPVVKKDRSLFLKTIFPSRKATKNKMKEKPE